MAAKRRSTAKRATAGEATPTKRRARATRSTAAKNEPPIDPSALEIHEVTPDRWADFERLFESPGAPKYCWCMAWRTTGERIRAGVPVGILGYLDGEPVAWCSVAPRETHQRLGGLEVPDEGPGDVWSITCFFLKRNLRGNGLSRRMLDGAIAVAKAHGAKVVEAYPVDPDSPSYRFMGFRPLYAEAGFDEVGRAGSRRHVVRLNVRR